MTAALGNQQAALFGQNCFDEGDAKITYGTGSFSLMHTGETMVGPDHGLLAAVAFQRPGGPIQYALEGRRSRSVPRSSGWRSVGGNPT